MTRINCIPVTELTDQHLMAEYRELPMVGASLNRSRLSRNGVQYSTSQEYTLNKGHVTFFYDKGKYLEKRYAALIQELTVRGYILSQGRNTNLHFFLPKEMNDWVPSKKAIELNLARISERISLKPQWYRFHGKSIDVTS